MEFDVNEDGFIDREEFKTKFAVWEKAAGVCVHCRAERETDWLLAYRQLKHQQPERQHQHQYQW